MLIQIILLVGFLWQTLYSGVESPRVGADWDSARNWYAVLETCTLATSSVRCFALSKLENDF